MMVSYSQSNITTFECVFCVEILLSAVRFSTLFLYLKHDQIPSFMGMVIMHEETLERIHLFSCLCESLGNHGGLVLYHMICCISLCEFLSLSWM
jgi:hypothetical protein